jgi:hypothetical protein
LRQQRAQSHALRRSLTRQRFVLLEHRKSRRLTDDTHRIALPLRKDKSGVEEFECEHV